MISVIKKRDGREVEFDINKISQAIFKAAQAVGGSDQLTAHKLALEVVEYLESKNNTTPTVEEIQDAVEHTLIENGHSRTAKEFILYRSGRTRVREMNTRLMKVFEELTFKDAIDNDIKRENANIDGDTAMGTMLKYGSESAKQFYEMFILNPKHSRAHLNGDIHIHDLDFLTLTTTCCQIDLSNLFKGGFSTGHGHLREPNDIQSYAALACIAIQSNQNDQHGGQSVPSFDYDMAAGVAKTYRKLYYRNLLKVLDILGIETPESTVEELKARSEAASTSPTLGDCADYDHLELSYLSTLLGEETAQRVIQRVKDYTLKETDRSTYQAMEALVHNLNTMHSRAGAQIPFSSINYGTDTSPEGRLVTKNLLLATDAGLGGGETAIFPIHIFKVKEGINYNPQDPNYDLFQLACKVSAKRLFPNFSFIDAPYNIPFYKEGHPETEVAYMGCRTRVMSNIHDPSCQTTPGRGNLSFTSINLPRLAIEANGDQDLFFKELNAKIDIVIDQLLERFMIQSRKKVKNYPFLMGQGVWKGSEKLTAEDTVGEVLKHGTLTLGFIGLAECLTALVGSHHGESEEAKQLGLKIVKTMRERMDAKSQEAKLNFTLIATPAEGLSGRFVKMDRKKYGEIKGVTDKEYYTNSFHIPVGFPITAYDKIHAEAPYHALTNAGHITYVELDGDPAKNLAAFESIIRIMKDAGIGYGSINHPVDRDPVCGYTGIIDNECPKCGRKEDDQTAAPIERIRRITGYLVGTLDRINNAKRAEVNDRVKHGIVSDMETL